MAALVDDQFLGAADAGLAHAARDNSSMRGLAATRRQHTHRRDDPGQVVRCRLVADQDDVLAGLGSAHCGGRVEHCCSDGRAGRGVDPGRHPDRVRDGLELREHQLRQILPGDAAQRLVEVDDALVHELARDPERGRRGSFANARLQHPQLAALDGELDVAQVAVVLFENVGVVQQLLVGRRVDPFELGDRERVTSARDDVLALGVRKVVAVQAALSRAWVAGERNARPGVRALVAEHHGHDIHGRAEIVRNLLPPPVERRSLGVPRVEDRANRHVELLSRVLRELPAGRLADHLLERRDQVTQVNHGYLSVGAAGALLCRREQLGKAIIVDAQHGAAEHLDQATVGVKREALVADLRCESLDRIVIETYVEHRLHHPGHRVPRA